MSPRAPLRPCTRRGCRNLTRGGGPCAACAPELQRAEQRAWDLRRGSAASRGYDRRWRAYVANYAARHPLCGQRDEGLPATGDSVCCRPTAMRVVDHVVPIDGPNDPRFWDPTNHQSLCDPCHNRKRARESREARRRDRGVRRLDYRAAVERGDDILAESARTSGDPASPARAAGRGGGRGA